MKKVVNQRYVNLLLCVAMLMLLVTAILPILGYKWDWLRYAFAAGALLTLVAQILTPNNNKELRARRLARMNVWAAILYCVSAGCLFVKEPTMQQSWVAFLLAGAVLQLYATLMLKK
jgi:uncharacterized membrane protein